MHSRAKGRLIERHGIEVDEAFTLLTRRFQNTDVKLRDVAAEFLRTGGLPGNH